MVVLHFRLNVRYKNTGVDKLNFRMLTKLSGAHWDFFMRPLYLFHDPCHS